MARLEDHPNLPEVLGVLAQLPHIQDSDLPKLAAAWTNSPALAAARDAALAPDSPLVLEVLAAFEAVTALFADDLHGDAPYLTVDSRTTSTALKAVRDAIAASYAEPVLPRADHELLMRPWRTVYPVALVVEPDLGPNAEQVKALLTALPQLASRCHDADGRELFESLVDRSFAGEADRQEARQAAFDAAVLTSRRRVWALVRRSGTEGMSRPCPSCRGRSAGDEREVQRVLTLCLDAACALLVADAISDETTSALTSPVAALIPPQRSAGA